MKHPTILEYPTPSETARPVGSFKALFRNKYLILCAVFSIVALGALLFTVIYANRLKSNRSQDAITDATRIAAYDSEFADFVGSGHQLADYCYIDANISHELGFGYGPLYDFAGYQIIIGKTGAVGAIAYGKYADGKWNMNPGPDCDWTTAFVMVFDGCVAPEAWWNRPVLASMLYGVPTTDGQYLPELMVWVPWPDWMDFDNPPVDAIIQAQSWYWNGSQFVPTKFADDRLSPLSSSPKTA